MTSDDLTPSTHAIPAEFDDAIVWAAWLYYEDQLTQNDIAKKMAFHARPSSIICRKHGSGAWCGF